MDLELTKHKHLEQVMIDLNLTDIDIEYGYLKYMNACADQVSTNQPQSILYSHLID